MRLLFLALALSAATSASAASVTPRDMPVIDPNGPAAAVCPPTSRYEAARRSGKLRMQKLNELPPADMYNAVYRRVGGCEAPIIVRYNVGGASQSGR